MERTIEDNQLNLRRRNYRLINEEIKDPDNLGPIVGYALETPLSLLDACKPLVGIVDDILNYASAAMETTPVRPADGLTCDESASIRLYTMEWTRERASLYFILNRTLKTDDRDKLRPWYKYLTLFLTALVKVPCAHSQTVWRGVRDNVSSTFPPATQVTWWSFSSCTTTLTVLESELYLGPTGKRTLFSIEVFNARNISAHSYFANEDEILLLPGTYMEVRSQLNPTEDLHIIHLRQMMPKTTLLEPPFKDAPIYPIPKSSKQHWYRKKKYFVPISVLIIMCIVALIIGLTLGTKSSNNSGTLTSKPADGICATATWAKSGVTVAGGKDYGAALDQLYSPDGLFLQENGSLYVVDSGNDRIIKWDSGVSSGYIVAGGNSAGNSSDQLNYPVDVVVDSNGTMYISDFSNQRVQQLFQNATMGQTILSNRIFTGIGRDSEGSLYTTDWTDSQLKKWRKGETIPQILAFGLKHPDRLYVDRNNTVYATDRLNHRVIMILPGTTNSVVVAGGTIGNSTKELNSPRGVTVDASGNVYVADTENHRIMRWLAGATSGTLIVGGRGEGSQSDQLDTPTDLQFDPNGNLYVSDSYNHRVQKFMIDKSSC